mmetsp:Transcript_86005/g.216492  ORF Transcript_86005/g.216492 Transcript_86005/m.216492 type:complete len:231 (+) Transcript_86005:647-1339(+)
MQPTIRSAEIARNIRPPGSTDSKALPSNWPPCFKKYHHGNPFCIERTMVLSWKSLGKSSNIGRIWCALSAMITTSTFPTSATEPTARTRTSSSWPSSAATRMPCLCCMALRWSRRANRVTCSPTRASRAPTSPPMAPAPTTHHESGCRLLAAAVAIGIGGAAAGAADRPGSVLIGPISPRAAKPELGKRWPQSTGNRRRAEGWPPLPAARSSRAGSTAEAIECQPRVRRP